MDVTSGGSHARRGVPPKPNKGGRWAHSYHTPVEELRSLRRRIGMTAPFMVSRLISGSELFVAHQWVVFRSCSYTNIDGSSYGYCMVRFKRDAEKGTVIHEETPRLSRLFGDALAR